VPPNIKITVFYQYYTDKGASDSQFLACWGAPIFLVLKSALNLKRLKNTGVDTNG